MLKRLSALNDKSFPRNEKELEIYLNSNLKESTADMAVEPPFSSYMGDQPFIFVSYTHKDKGEVYPILQKLHHKGFRIWYDEGIPLTTDWCNTIAEKLLQSNIFLSFISPYVMDFWQYQINSAGTDKITYPLVHLRRSLGSTSNLDPLKHIIFSSRKARCFESANTKDSPFAPINANEKPLFHINI